MSEGVTPFSLSKRTKRAQFHDLRRRGYTEAEAEAEVAKTDDAIIRRRKHEETTP